MKLAKGVIFIFLVFFLFILYTVKASAAIIYQDNFNGASGLTLDSYNPSFTKYIGSDYIYLTGNNSAYSPVYGVEYYNGPFTSTQGIQFDFTTNFLINNVKQQYGVELFAHGAGNRAADIYLEIFPDSSARIINIDATHIVYFPIGYFSNNTTYTVFFSYDGNIAKTYLNGNLIDLYTQNFTGYTNGSFALQLSNYACITNFYYTDSLTPLSTGSPSHFNCNPANFPPVISGFSAVNDPIAVNSTFNISATFTDANTRETHTAVWDWGDNTTSAGTINESNGSGSASAAHVYTSAGVYGVNLTVTDSYGASSNASYQYVVVYDPSADFVTGSGKYNSLAGWDLQNPQATGDVKFGIQAKYINGTAPEGKTKWNFKNGNLDFESTSYQWLVVSSNKATLKGNGTINGSGNYTFLTSVIDGSQTVEPDLIRFQIKDSSNVVIYDSQLNAADTADPTTQITSGSIRVH